MRPRTTGRLLFLPTPTNQPRQHPIKDLARSWLGRSSSPFSMARLERQWRRFPTYRPDILLMAGAALAATVITTAPATAPKDAWQQSLTWTAFVRASLCAAVIMAGRCSRLGIGEMASLHSAGFSTRRIDKTLFPAWEHMGSA